MKVSLILMETSNAANLKIILPLRFPCVTSRFPPHGSADTFLDLRPQQSALHHKGFGWVAHAFRVLAVASRYRELFQNDLISTTRHLFHAFRSPLRRDATTSTRDACATLKAG
ncbi:MAG: hypothetical protein DMF19_13075 [Verrucomicrobia bacterium]|nr:MAG: hypothetical protein DMF19_13075 [Verrucomicrobiota bacterium]